MGLRTAMLPTIALMRGGDEDDWGGHASMVWDGGMAVG